jgi:predicted ATPase
MSTLTLRRKQVENLGMVQTINVYSFRDAFEKMGRKDQFSYEGLGVIYELEEERNEGRTYELDVIGLCGDYREYEDYIELYKEYSNLFGDDEPMVRLLLSEEEILETIEKYTLVRKFEGGIIIQAF